MRTFFLATALIVASAAIPAQAQDMTKAQIESIIREYIKNNPEVILDSVEAYGRQQQQRSQADRQEAVDAHIDWILNNDTLPVAGNPDGKVTIVEFYDYNCGYCKKALSDITTLIEENDEVKVIFMEMPILGRTSELAARWALAADEQDAFLPFHISLMQNRAPITEDELERIARSHDLDVEQMRADAQSAETTKMINEKADKAAAMGISGTPAFIIDGQLYGGYIGLDAMRRAVDEALD